MLFVVITWQEGRSKEQKAKVADEITKILVKDGQPFWDEPALKPEQVTVIFNDVKKDNWALNGKLASERPHI